MAKEKKQNTAKEPEKKGISRGGTAAATNANAMRFYNIG